jgi:acylphosphatase
MASVRAVIRGRVQGVGFRFFIYDLAHEYGLKGFVRNLYDGRVEIQADGEEDVLRDFLLEVKKGPPLAVISHVETEWQNEERGFYDFQIAR